MNKIYKVIYSKVKQCYIVVSELAKSHVKSSHGSNGQQKAALTMSVLLALGAFTFAFGPTTAEAEDKTDTTGWQFIGVWHKSSDEGNTSENYQSHDLTINNSGATGEHSIAIGVHTQAGPRTIVIGDRLATTSQDSVFIGSGYDANGVRQQAKGGSDVVVIGSSADATGTGSIALGYGATADPWKNVDDTNQTNANKNSNSIALGYKAQAENNNIAIGANSVATDAASKTAALYTGQAAAKSYVSVGTRSELMMAGMPYFSTVSLTACTTLLTSRLSER
jgi:trimeric autotransporter adhesin